MSDAFDLVVIGAGASGEATADLAASHGASVALIEKDLVGGSCAYWACMPSKALLHAAEVRAGGGDYEWPKASAFRDWMINRVDRPYPDDSSHARGHERQGVTIVRGTGRLNGPRRVEVSLNDGGTRTLTAERGVVLATGSRARIPAARRTSRGSGSRRSASRLGRASSSGPMGSSAWRRAPTPSGT